MQEDYTWTLLVTGDVMLGRTVNTRTIQKNDFAWAFKNTADFLKSADLTFINLESPLVENCPQTDTGMIFCEDVRHVEGLKFASIDIASVANNHSLNYGEKGLKNTKEILQSEGVLPVGITNPKYTKVKGIKIALLGFDDVECYPNYIECAGEENVKNDIKEASQNSDLVIVMFSWGVEYTDSPNKRQVDLAHLAIDSGADLILGNHPHWIQPEEIYKGKLIKYSHGNFIFDQMWSEETRKGVIGKYTFKGTELEDHEYVSVKIYDYGQPAFE